MTILARMAIKVLLFCALFLLAGRYVHTYPLPMTPQQQHYLIVISGKFGVADYELFYIVAMIVLDLIVAAMVYLVVMKAWRRFGTRRNGSDVLPETHPE